MGEEERERLQTGAAAYGVECIGEPRSGWGAGAGPRSIRSFVLIAWCALYAFHTAYTLALGKHRKCCLLVYEWLPAPAGRVSISVARWCWPRCTIALLHFGTFAHVATSTRWFWFANWRLWVKYFGSESSRTLDRAFLLLLCVTCHERVSACFLGPIWRTAP